MRSPQRPIFQCMFYVLAVLPLLFCGCQRPNRPVEPARPQLTVAAAANLSGVMEEIGLRFESETGAHIVCSFGSTGNLAKQIEQSAPFDVFAAADTEHVEALNKKELLAAGTIAVYARGRLAVWAPPSTRVHIGRMEDLVSSKVHFVAIARPESAPYGRASVEALQALKLWDAVQPKVVYAENITMAKQYAQTGNADASFTAYSLVLREQGKVILVDEHLYRPIDQATAVLKNSQKQESARQFVNFLLGPKAREILQRYGYVFPPS
jgi:molybdate transport system substrate-binding protein